MGELTISIDRGVADGRSSRVDAANDDVAGFAGGKGSRTRQAILEVAIRQFAVAGFRGTSVPGVAREVGVSASSVYTYFSTKQSLFEAAVDADVTALIVHALPDVLAGHFDGDFPLIFKKLVRNLAAHPLARRVLEGAEDTGAERLVVLPSELRLRRGIAEALLRGQGQGTVRLDIDPDVHAAGLEAIVISLLMSILQTGGLSDPDYTKGVFAVLDAAIRAPG